MKDTDEQVKVTAITFYFCCAPMFESTRRERERNRGRGNTYKDKTHDSSNGLYFIAVKISKKQCK